MNQLLTRTISERAEEVVKRQEPQNPSIKACEINNKFESDPNYHVSKFCDVCKSSDEDEMPPILAEILFENTTVEFPLKFSSCGDGQLVDL